MAEHFWGRRHTVHTSNRGCEEMFHAWIQVGENIGPTPQTEAVLEFLRSRLQLGDGVRSFSLDPPPPELAEPGRLSCFATMVAGFADDLARGRPDPRIKVGWNQELELIWLAQMLDLYDLINEALPPGTEPLNPLTPALTHRNQAQCEYYRLCNRLADHNRRIERGQMPRDPRAKLDLVDRILRALAEQEPSLDRSRAAAHYLNIRGELLLGLGDRASGIKTLREAADVEPDSEMRRELAELVAFLEKESGS
jgi:hypothetical protein